MILITSSCFPAIEIKELTYDKYAIDKLVYIYGAMCYQNQQYMEVFNIYPTLIASNLAATAGRKFDIGGRYDIKSYSYPELLTKLSTIAENQYLIIQDMFINNRGVCRIAAFTLDSFVRKDEVYAYLRRKFIDEVLNDM